MKRKQMKNETVSFLNLVDLSYGFEGIPIYITIYVLLFGVCAVVGVLGNTTVYLLLLQLCLRKGLKKFCSIAGNFDDFTQQRIKKKS